MGEVLCFRAQGHAGAEFVNVRQRVALVASVHADERARVPSFRSSQDPPALPHWWQVRSCFNLHW